MKENGNLSEAARDALLHEWFKLQELKGQGKKVDEAEKRVQESLSKLYKKGDEKHGDK